MKKIFVITSGILVGGLIIAMTTTAFAGNRLWNSGWNNASSQRTHTVSTRGMHNNQRAYSTTHSGMLATIPTSTLSEEEKQELLYGYSEEMVARDAYNYFYSLYGTEVFKRIADSEQQHMNAVKTLLDRYSLTAPTGYGELQSTFDALKLEGQKGIKEALEVGLKIEILDIEDITKTIKTTDNEDVKSVFLNIGGASYNHLRSFSNEITRTGKTSAVDISRYLSSNEIASRGSLQYKLSDRLIK